MYTFLEFFGLLWLQFLNLNLEIQEINCQPDKYYGRQGYIRDQSCSKILTLHDSIIANLEPTE